MVEYVSFVCHEGFVSKGFFQCLYTFLVLLKFVISETLFVEYLSIFWIALQGSVKVSDSVLKLTHVEVALSSILQKVYINLIFAVLNCPIILLYCLNIVL